MTYKIHEMIGKKSPLGDTAIELEVEFKPNTEEFSSSDLPRNFMRKGDASLRNGAEIVNKSPFKFDKTKTKALIEEVVGTAEAHCVNNSPRTSMHVHRNMLHNTPLEALTTVFRYAMVEEAIAPFWGDQRVSNQYCPRITNDSHFHNQLVKCLDNSYFTRPQRRQLDRRYSALNIAALSKFGSYEFRSMRGQLNSDDLFTWVEFTDHITSYKRFGNPRSAINKYIAATDKEKFIRDLIPESLNSKIKIDEQILDRTDEVVLELAPLAFSKDSWEQWQDDEFKHHEDKTIEETLEAATSTQEALSGMTQVVYGVGSGSINVTYSDNACREVIYPSDADAVHFVQDYVSRG